MTDHERPFRAQGAQDAANIMDTLNELRTDQFLSQGTLAHELHTQQSHVSDMLARRIDPGLSKAAALARVVGACLVVDDGLYHPHTVALERPDPAGVVARTTQSALGESLVRAAAGPEFYSDRTLTLGPATLPPHSV